MIAGGRPLLRENLADTEPPTDLLSIFASAEKSSINTNRKFTTRFPMNLPYEHRTWPLAEPPIGWLKQRKLRKVSKI